MITGAHVVIYSTDAEADRVFLRDVLALDNVDVGHGWLIFKLPSAEAAVHPADANDRHELYLICEDIVAEVGRLAALGVECEAMGDQRWGITTRIPLPGGGRLGLYQPRHARP